MREAPDARAWPVLTRLFTRGRSEVITAWRGCPLFCPNERLSAAGASAAQCLGAPRVSSRDRFEMSGGNSLEPGLKKYRELQAQIAKLQSGAGQANTQIMENEMVLKEPDLLEEDAQVFKLIGPVLVKQELVEVKTNVSKRIEFIKNDIGRLESSVKAKEKEQEEVRSQIAKLQKQQAEATGGQ